MQSATLRRSLARPGRLSVVVRRPRGAASVRPLRVAMPDRSVSAAAAAAGSDEDAGNCKLYIDREGNMIQCMCCDYGFRAGAGRLYQDRYGEVPGGILDMASANFKHELSALRSSFRFNEYDPLLAANTGVVGKVLAGPSRAVIGGLKSLDLWLESNKLLPKLERPLMDAAMAGEDGGMSEECKEIREKLAQLKLNDDDVWAREKARIARGEGVVPAPWWIKVPFWLLCVILDQLFANRPIQRFWVLETVARIPYFSAISLLHLYESLGFWRAGAELRKIHFAEEWNELHHLQIMEALGGDQLWFDRFVAEHAALVYYWACIAFYMLAPKNAYQFCELVELHAVDTYAQFFETNGRLLKSLPPPKVAVAYYRNEDLYMFDEMQTCSQREPRRPVCNTLYDVFVNIRDDEIEHVNTMHACQSPAIAATLAERRNSEGASGGALPAPIRR
ncbi:MAG: alternative oxidase-domain-containing protein [Monoraphidium minutum]|nr:MAG: alternative oxidase-domain-containing protein [Monoraphidium minutum]